MKKKFYQSPFFWAFVIGVVVLPLTRPFLRHIPEPPPVLFELPPFQLVDENEQPFGSEQLKGQVYVASFVFTRCVSVCPLIAKAQSELQKRYQKENLPIQLVSISVDPEFDTPAELKKFGEKYQAEFGRWHFLTGPKNEIQNLVISGFKVDMGSGTQTENAFDIAHAQKFVIVDGSGGVRGFYNTDEMGIDETFHRSMHVLHQMQSK